MPNRRRRTRVPFMALVDVKTTGALLRELKSRDLSHKGVFVLGKHPLREGQSCMVTLHLPGDADTAPLLRMEGQVARITPDGTAIDFVSMDPDTYLHLRKVVVLNAQDPDAAEEEFAEPAFDASAE